MRRSDFSCPESLGSSLRFPFRPTAPEATRSPTGSPAHDRRPRATRQRALGSWTTLVHVPRAKDPGAAADQDSRGHAPALRSHRCCLPPVTVGVGPHHDQVFRGLPPWPVHPLSTLRSRPRGAGHARLAPRRRSSALPGRDFNPQGRFERFLVATCLPPLPSFPGARSPTCGELY